MKKPLFIILVVCITSSWAHEIRPAFLQIIQTEESSFDVFWKVPRLGDKVPKITPVFAPFFSIKELNNPNKLQGSVIYSYHIASKAQLQGSILSINGLNKTLIDVLVNIRYLNGEKVTFMLQPDKDSEVIPGQHSTYEVIKTYTLLGVEHILLGIDHLLFVLALILITKGKWRIIKTITAFTIAHSITLSMAALGFVDFPIPPVEAVIALSIVFLAVEIIKVINNKETLTSKMPWLIAFTFGLLHGFGFAGALTDIGLPELDIPLALAFFNIGVELGQLLFVLLVLGLMALLAKLKYNWPLWMKKIPAYAIGSMASFWLVERVVAFF